MSTSRCESLLPDGIPKYIRCYDNDGKTADRYTVVYTGRYRRNQDEFLFVNMSKDPFHPQGVGQTGFAVSASTSLPSMFLMSQEKISILMSKLKGSDVCSLNSSHPAGLH